VGLYARDGWKAHAVPKVVIHQLDRPNSTPRTKPNSPLMMSTSIDRGVPGLSHNLVAHAKCPPRISAAQLLGLGVTPRR